jgi:hypothetical protein
MVSGAGLGEELRGGAGCIDGLGGDFHGCWSVMVRRELIEHGLGSKRRRRLGGD